MFIVDAHLDLAYNALRYGRDLTASITEVRRAESGRDKPVGTPIVTFPELQKAGVGLVFATVFVAPARHRAFSSDQELKYRTAHEAHKLGQNQLDYYHRLADDIDYIRLVSDLAGLDEVVADHKEGKKSLVGLVPLMEGADPIREPAEAELWYARGLRIIGLAWDDTRYSPGAWRQGGSLTKDGWRLLDVMADLGIILDITHMSEEASLQALDRFEGTAIASHSNARALVPGQRQLSDLQIRHVAERGGVIGIALANSFLKANHGRSDPKLAVTLEHVVAHIDHVCQVVGDSEHVGIGSDLDGGFGVEEIPAELEDLTDLPLIASALKEHGYSQQDVDKIMGGNWLAVLNDVFSS